MGDDLERFPGELPTRPPTQKDLEWLRLRERGQAWAGFLRYCGLALLMVSTAIPIGAIAVVAWALAGKVTEIKVALGLSVVIGGSALSSVVTYLTTRSKLKEQGQELQRLRTANENQRGTIDDLKRELRALRGKDDAGPGLRRKG